MSKYLEFSKDEIEKNLMGDYFVVYMNYDKKNGIEIATNFSNLKKVVFLLQIIKLMQK